MEQKQITHTLSIDVEDWFMVQNFSSLYTHSDWNTLELRVEKSTIRLLDLFDKHNTKATFFVLGWVADKIPSLVQEIGRRGHEIASHGFGHEMVKEIGADRFDADLERALEALAKAGSTDIIGYRAPSFSVDPSKEWIFEILTKYGFKYDSSIFPVQFHPDYANGSAPLTPYQIYPNMTEFPMTCIPLFGKNLPCSGGGYFRMLPYQWFRFGFKQCEKEGRSGMFYLHPWEIDPEQPKVKDVPLSKRFRHYINQDKTLHRLDMLLSEFSFTTVRDILHL